MPDGISAQRARYLAGRRRARLAVHGLRALLLLSFFAGWELAARAGVIDPFIFSSPSRVMRTLMTMGGSGELTVHLLASLAETAAGFLLGTALGTLIAVMLWWSPFLARVLDPVLVVLNALPKTALGPIFIVWMGAGPGAIIAMTLAISLIVTILDMHGGFTATDPEKVRLLRTLGATKGQILRKLVLPANLAAMVGALKVNIGLSWVGVIMGEFLVSRAGLGYLIVYGSQVFKMDLVMTTVVLLAAAAGLMYRLVLHLESFLKKTMGVTV